MNGACADAEEASGEGGDIIGEGGGTDVGFTGGEEDFIEGITVTFAQE